MGVQVSIIICTRNRADSLRATLESVLACDVSNGITAELLVVDNGSTDQTAQVARQSLSRGISLRLIQEPTPGKSRACNRALAEARGSVLLWTDDDVRVPPSWIAAMCGPILSGQTDAVAGAVRIPSHLLAAVRGTPLESRLAWVASTHDLNFDRPESMVGANMAFGRHVLELVPSFDLNLGPGALGFYEETLFAWQLQRAGYRITGEPGPDAAVEHHFDVSRIDWPRLAAMAEAFGRSAAYFDRVRGRYTQHILARQVRAHLSFMLRSTLLRVRGGDPRSLQELQLDYLQWRSYLRNSQDSAVA